MTTQTTIAEAVAEMAQRLRAAGIEGERAEASLLVGHALGAGRETVICCPNRVLEPTVWDWLCDAVSRRVRREPLSHVLGRREFWSLEFSVTSDALDPRPDSETVIEATLAAIEDRDVALRVLDLGTGTGCLLLALLSELPNATGVGTDVSAAALDLAHTNAETLGLCERASFHYGDWDCGLDGRFDVVVSNPPYIPSAEISRLQPEISLYEPRLALDGGLDGLDGYRSLSALLPRRLCAGAVAVVELGSNQLGRVRSIMLAVGLDIAGIRNDLGNMPRCLVLRARPNLTGL